MYYLLWTLQQPVIVPWGSWVAKRVRDCPGWVLVSYGTRIHTHVGQRQSHPSHLYSVLPPTHNAEPDTQQSHASGSDKLQGKSGNFMGMSKTKTYSCPSLVKPLYILCVASLSHDEFPISAHQPWKQWCQCDIRKGSQGCKLVKLLTFSWTKRNWKFWKHSHWKHLLTKIPDCTRVRRQTCWVHLKYLGRR